MSVGHAQIILAWFTIGYTNTWVLCAANVFELCQLYSYELTIWNRTQKYISSSNGQSELAKIFQEGNANSINNQANHKKRGKTHVTQMPMGFSFASDWLRDMVAWVFSNQSHSEIKHIRCNHRLLATLIWYLPKVLYLGTIKFGRNSELLLQSTTLKEKKWVSFGTLCRSLNPKSFLSWGNWLLNCRLF